MARAYVYFELSDGRENPLIQQKQKINYVLDFYWAPIFDNG